MRRLSFGLSALLALAAVPWAAGNDAPTPTSKLGGQAMFDYSYQVDSEDEAAKGVFGGKVRRVYLTYDYAMKPNYKARVRLETNDGVNLLKDGDSSVVGLLVKDAYMQWDITADWAEAIKPSLVFGIQGTPAFGHLEEGAWKYRSVEKTHLDLRKIVSSRDMGVGAKGKFGDSGIAYRVLIGNDTTKAETNEEKRYYGVVSYAKSGFGAEAYSHMRQRAGDEGEVAAKGLAGYDNGEYAAYVSAFSRMKSDVGGVAGADVTSVGVSAFGRYAVSDEVELIARHDFYDPDTDAEDDATMLVILGAAYRPIPQVAFIPNVRVEIPEDSDVASDVVARVTVHYKF
jgi:hypothetical protein